MSESDAQAVIVGTIIVVAAVVAWHGLRTGGKATPSLRTFVALLTLGAVLLLLASVAPQVAGPFALLIGIGVVVSRLGR